MSTTKEGLSIGLIGAGFIGRAHGFAWRMADAVFDLPRRPLLHTLAEADPARAEEAADRLGFAASTARWEDLVADPAIGLVDIATPNVLHEPMALAAIAARKPVYCEKPLAPTAAAARRLVEAAEAACVPTFVGFNYLKNPMVRLARDLVRAGEIGELWSFRGIHAEDYMSDALSPWTWRLDPAGGAGAAADLGSHIISLARFVVGPIAELCADLDTVVASRPVGSGSAERRPVEVDDQARALLRFANGAKGTLEANWIATGRKMDLAFEVYGSKGSILINMERMNELRLYVQGRGPTSGYVEVPAGPEHEDYAPFCPAPGHQLGFIDIKTIEVAHVIRALAGGPAFQPDFREAWEVQKVVDAMLVSARERCWVEVEELA